MGIEQIGQPTNPGINFPTPDLTGLPPETGQVIQSLQQQPMVIVAGMVGITAMTEEERRSLLCEVDVQDALVRVAEIQAQWDIASTTHWNIKPLQLDLLVSPTADWVPAVWAEVNRGNVFTSPQVTIQLMRELMETDSTSSRPLSADELVHLLLSIATEQQTHTEFGSDVPTNSEFAKLDAKLQAMAPDELYAAAHQFLHDQTAGVLFNAPRKIECLNADVLDFWYSPWADRAADTLGDTPADTFKSATGIAFDDFLRAGVTVAEAVASGQTIVRFDDLADDGQVRDFITENMSLDLARYREQLAADRERGDVKLQRYTFTRYPFLDLGDGKLLILRAQWVTERFFGDPAQLDVVAAFAARGDKTSAKRFGEGIKYQFEDVVGGVLTRIAARSQRIDTLVPEADMEREWMEKKGQKPSVCDWALRAGLIDILVEATHHPVNAALAQGLADGETYSADTDKILTDRKFKQLASVMGLVRRLGWSGQPQPDAIFIPIVVVPNSGTPSSMLSELDNGNRAMPIFTEFQGHVARPAVLQLQDLQLLEGIGDHLPVDVVQFLYAWRKFPVPLSLQEFLEMNNDKPRPLSKHIVEAAARLDQQLRTGG
ncbi:hypothetical protein OG874_08430 [Nocardia sp. NBC_00565]|uniref:hypothetical protein n=1 Tax=Nocardia sp. NBC_00565 TaxID=2975993 RepID=UPI002E80EFD5|nr:hypothetical protein [Nocardia sp. NBC_00565]WUC05159.1 hypothetical protein OG874_08430 [Nocardia sp. NBC_00565]